MTRKERAEIQDLVMDVCLKADEQNVKCCFVSGEICMMDVVPCCDACNKPVVEAWEANDVAKELFCSGCNQMVPVRNAMYCWICGVCIFPEDMHEQIAREESRHGRRRTLARWTT